MDVKAGTKTVTAKAKKETKEKIFPEKEYAIVRVGMKRQPYTPEVLKVMQEQDFNKLLITRDRYGVLKYTLWKYQKKQ